MQSWGSFGPEIVAGIQNLAWVPFWRSELCMDKNHFLPVQCNFAISCTTMHWMHQTYLYNSPFLMVHFHTYHRHKPGILHIPSPCHRLPQPLCKDGDCNTLRQPQKRWENRDELQCYHYGTWWTVHCLLMWSLMAEMCHNTLQIWRIIIQSYLHNHEQ